DAEAGPAGGRLLHGRHDGRVGMSEDRRAPRLHVVEEPLAVGGADPRAVTLGYEEGLASHTGKRPDRRVHATGDHVPSPRPERGAHVKPSPRKARGTGSSCWVSRSNDTC